MGVFSQTGCSKGYSKGKPVRIETLEQRMLLSGDYHLTFDDEFNAFQLWNGTSGWNSTDLHGNRIGSPDGGQKQYYADPTVPGYNPFSVSSGVLSITANHTPGGMSAQGMPYVSGMISTASDFSQKYGYFEMRAKLPAGKGFWPAFWMIPADGMWPPEYDIFEVLGHDTDRIYQYSHWRNVATGSNTGTSGEYTGHVDTADGFHTYGLKWEQDTVVWYVDGVATQTITNVMFEPAYMIANFAVGGNWPGNPDGTTPFPSSMQIDYIRVYSKDATIPTATPQAGYTESSVITQLNASTVPTTPLPWDNADVGSPALNGSASVSGGTWTVNGSGAWIGNTSDQFHFAYQKMSGDSSIQAKVDTISNTDPWAKAGVMYRENFKANARFVSVSRTPSNGVTMQWRLSPGAAADGTTLTGVTGPIWVKLVRTGDSFVGSYSLDGTSWTTINTQTVSMNSGIYAPSSDAYAGLAVTSRNTGLVATATFSSVAASAGLGQFTATGDIGSPGQAGSTYTNGLSYVVKGGGAGILGNADAFHMLRKSWTGDATLIAKITDMSNTDVWAKSGVMLRSSTAAGSAFAAVLATPSNGVRFLYRTATNVAAAGSGVSMPMPSPSAPLWVKLVRIGNNITGYYSTDGVAWTAIASQAVALGSTVLAGPAVSANNNAALNTTVFSDVSLSNVTGQFTSASDLASPGLAGSTTWDGRNYTVRGGGAGWNTTDPSHFVSQNWTGNGTFITKVTSSEWSAKAGIMFRNSSSADSPFVTLSIVEGNIYFQHRATAGAGVTTVISYPRWTPKYDRPIWLKLVRSSNTWTASWSSNGTTYANLGTPTPNTATVALNSTTLAGLFVNARDNAKLRTATFTDLTLSP